MCVCVYMCAGGCAQGPSVSHLNIHPLGAKAQKAPRMREDACSGARTFGWLEARMPGHPEMPCKRTNLTHPQGGQAKKATRPRWRACHAWEWVGE